MSSDNQEIVKLVVGSSAYDLPIVKGSEGERGLDISSLRAKTGMITLDPAYMNTGACLSHITFIDGDKGILRYRGIPIETLCAHSNFLETAFLLMFGKLPTAQELNHFTRDVSENCELSEHAKALFKCFPKEAHPMSVLGTVLFSLSSDFGSDGGDPGSTFYDDAVKIIAKIPTIVAYSYRHSQGLDFIDPNTSLGFCERFLNMLTGETNIEPEKIRALDLLLILHADHEQNCSTSTVRMARSSRANLVSCIAAGVSALWGKRHGGANQEVIEMLQAIEKLGSVEEFVAKVKDKSSKTLLMGFGHRVYKNYDPRATIIKRACDALLKKINISNVLLDLARELEIIALSDPYFIERKLYPNVDFYSGLVYKALGIPDTFFTAMFAFGRAPGWLAHAKEFSEETSNKISRPRQIYVGPTVAPYVPIENRI
jgi:citrate synthase